MPITQKLDVIEKNLNQIWNQSTKVSLNQAPNPRQQEKSSKLLPSVIDKDAKNKLKWRKGMRKGLKILSLFLNPDWPSVFTAYAIIL